MKAYTTIEALVASVLLLTVVSISVIIILNIMASNKSNLKYRAEQILKEIALNYEESNMDDYEDQFIRIEMTKKLYSDFEDVWQIELMAYDRNGVFISDLSFLKKRVNED